MLDRLNGVTGKPACSFVLLALVLVTGSACVTGASIRTGPRPYEATPASKSIDTYFQGQSPGRAFDEVGLVNARYRGGTGLFTPEIATLLPTLHAKARELGADAILITHVNDHPYGGLHPAYVTNPILEISAIAIRYSSLPVVEARRESSDRAPIVERGTGFAVSRTGLVLTNAHVVQDCKEMRTASAFTEVRTTALVAIDPSNDLALLKVSPAPDDAAVFREGRGLRQGDTILAIGFPLPGVLASEASLTTGTVTALAGLRDDVRYLQVSAPIQAGNSGGPLLDGSGNVVGVVSATLNSDAAVQLTGNAPQNVNFAIHGSVVKVFLDSKGVDYETAPSTVTYDAADIGRRARKFVLAIECAR